MNIVIVRGRLVADPEVININGTQLTNFSLAVNEKWRDKNGQEKENTNFLRCVAFGGTAQAMQSYRKKGDEVFIEGKLQEKRWEDKQGNKRSMIEIVANRVHFGVRAKPKSERQEEGGDDL